MATRSITKDGAQRYEVAVLAHALDLLFAIGEAPEVRLSTTEVSKRLGISRSTAYRLLLTLESRGVVEHHAATRGWTLGWRLFALAQRSRAEKLREAAAEAMRRILEQERETVNLAAYSAGELVYIATLDSPHPFRMTELPGEIAPLHATALGKAVLAALADEARAALLEELELRPMTENTVGSRRELEKQLELIRSRGWSMESGEAAIGVTCVGAAILDGSGSPIAAMSVSVPDVRLTPQRAERIGELVADAARLISSKLGVPPRVGEGATATR